MAYTAHVDRFAQQNLPPKSLWPRFLLKNPDVTYPTRLNATVALLDDNVNNGLAEKSVLHTDAATCTYRQLQARVNQISHVLTRDLKLVPGNRVLLRGANNPMMAACLLAVMRCGLIAVPTMPLLRAPELIKILDKAKVCAALCDLSLIEELKIAKKNAHTLKQVLTFNDSRSHSGALEHRLHNKPIEMAACETAATDTALIAFTSGTTGSPKGTMHFHRDVVAMCDLFPRHVLKPGRDDIFCGTPPLAFTFGLGGMLAFPMRSGASSLLIERASPASLLEAIERHRATICFTAPTFYRQMAELAKDYDLSSLKKCVSAGEALPDATRRSFKSSTGLQIIDGIGATEMIHIFISTAGRAVRSGAVGKVVPGYEAKIVGPKMQDVEPGQVGRLAVRGPTGCRYLDDPRQREYVQDGWNLTGDTFKMDGDGYFFYQARSDDMIVSAGYNIAGPEVEDALLKHGDVAECAVIGEPDPERGQIVTAHVVLKPGRDPGDKTVKLLQDWVKKTIAPYKYPRQVEFVDTLPRTETGKVQRFKLRKA